MKKKNENLTYHSEASQYQNTSAHEPEDVATPMLAMQEIIASLRDQARDKEALANGDEASIFAQDAKALCEAIDLLEKLTAERDECKRRAEAAELTLQDALDQRI